MNRFSRIFSTVSRWVVDGDYNQQHRAFRGLLEFHFRRFRHGFFIGHCKVGLLFQM